MYTEKINLIESLKPHYSKSQLSDYLSMQFDYMADITTIDFFSFYNYVNYPLPISQRLFNIYSSSSNQTMTKASFIKAMTTIYFGSNDERIQFLVNLFDFTKDNAIYIEDIELLITHFYFFSNETSLSVLQDHFHCLFEKKKRFTSNELKTFILENPDLYYYFIMNFLMRKPFDDSNISFSSRRLKPIETKYGHRHSVNISMSNPICDNKTFLPSVFLYYYFKRFEFQANNNQEPNEKDNDDNDMNELNSFENDLCKVKEQVNEDHFKPRFAFNKQTVTESALIKPASHHRTLSSESCLQPKNSVCCFNFSFKKYLSNIIEPINGFIKTNNSNFTSVMLYIIKEDLYAFKVNKQSEEESLFMFMSLKHSFIKQKHLQCLRSFNLHLSENTVKKVFYFNIISQLSSESKKVKVGFYEEEQAITFKNLIKEVTHFSNVNDYYQDIAQINQGSFGTIYKIKHKTTEKIYAKKVLYKKKHTKHSTLLGYKNEEYIFGLFVNLVHPNIAKCYEMFEDDQAVYIIQEYYPDGSLQTFLTNHQKTLSLTIIENIMKELISSLKFLYKLGIVHRDLKNENILMSGKQTKIIDFGLSTILGKFETKTELCGSLGYSAPELLKKEPYNYSIDIWSFGVIAYYLFYGQFHYENKIAINNINCFLNWTLENKFDFPTKCQCEGVDDKKKKIRQLIMKCLEKKAESRANIISLSL